EDFRLEVARSIARTKVRHQIALLREFDTDGLLDTSDYSRFEDSVNDIQKAYSITEIMGYEGRLAKSYFLLSEFTGS
ncbi:MAG: CRISPR-associated endonuclease Cas1, partial [Streptococcus sp.]|nr:CRISPR-associated endonuclease Cas1 [Streptococcus sp.]